MTQAQDSGSTVLTDEVDRSTLAAAISPWNERQHGIVLKRPCEFPSETEQPQKRPCPEEFHRRTADNARVAETLNGINSQVSGTDLADFQDTGDSLTVVNGYIPLSHDSSQESGTLDMIQQRDTVMAIQSTNWDSPNALTPGPSLRASKEDVDLLQSCSSDNLYRMAFTDTTQENWGDMDSMLSWVDKSLKDMGFPSYSQS